MEKSLCICVFFSVLLSIFFFSASAVFASVRGRSLQTFSPPAGNGQCPGGAVGVIQRIDPDQVIRCYQAVGGLGFNTAGLQQLQACTAPVLCPMEPGHDNLQRGQSCIRQDAGGVCHPGTGASGFFDKTSDPDACTPNTAVTIPCPPPLPLYIKAVDQNGTLATAAYIELAYNDAPPAHTKPKRKTLVFRAREADGLGIVKVTGFLHAGDHFTLTPLTSSYVRDTDHMIGNSNKFFQEEVGTDSCGNSPTDPCVLLVSPATTSNNYVFWWILIIIGIGLFLKYVMKVI